MSLTIKCYPYGPLQENTYLITDDATGLKAVVDPGYIGDAVRSDIGDMSSLRYILLTHGHYDHFAAVRSYISEYPDACFVVPEAESYLLYKSDDNRHIAINTTGGVDDGSCPRADITVSEGSEITLGETVLRIIETPGHTEGGLCFASDEDVFTGDTLFRLSVGNTSFETGDWHALVSSIRNKLYTLDDSVRGWPGHGGASTIGYEKRANPFV